MIIVRILNALHFDPRKQRFTSLAFKNSTGGGISVIHKECIQQQGNSVCEHIEQFYPPPTSSIPAIYWEFAEEQLPIGYQLEQQTSASGDHCHYNIEAISDKSAREMLLHTKLSDFQICQQGQSRAVTLADLVSQNDTE